MRESLDHESDYFSDYFDVTADVVHSHTACPVGRAVACAPTGAAVP